MKESNRKYSHRCSSWGTTLRAGAAAASALALSGCLSHPSGSQWEELFSEVYLDAGHTPVSNSYLDLAEPQDSIGELNTGGVLAPDSADPLNGIETAAMSVPRSAPLMQSAESIGASPRPWLEFCRSDPSRTQCISEPAVVEANEVRLHQLAAVQAMVHETTHQQPDPVEMGDYWELIDRGRVGDCEDMALTKRDILMTWGWPAGALHPAICIIDEQGDTPSQLHAVLTVDTTEGTYVLGNLLDEVRTIETSECSQWVMRTNGVNWSWIEGGTTIPLQKASHNQ